jgi:hypothetical protein
MVPESPPEDMFHLDPDLSGMLVKLSGRRYTRLKVEIFRRI